MKRKKPLRERLTPELVKALENRTMTNEEVAAKLQVNASYLSTVFNSLSSKKRGEVALQRENAHKLVEARRQLRIREAKKVCNGTKSLEKAAKDAKCSERTMRRYVERVAPTIPGEAYE